MTKTYDTLSTISISDLDANLRAELDAEGFAAFEAPEMDGDYVTGNSLHIAYHDASGRAGIVYVGSGSSGMTHWTDASSAEDALRRYLEDDMIA